MTSTTFVANQTIIRATWLNDVNTAVYKAASGEAGALDRTAVAKFADFVSVKDYGAVGDGAADDTTALTAAEAAAYAAGKSLYLPEGTYCFNGQWAVRVNLWGHGTTVKQIQPNVITLNTQGVVCPGASDLWIEGLTVDGGLKSIGFAGVATNRLVLRQCYAVNCVNAGFALYSSDAIRIEACRASNVRYSAVPSTGSPADGFYFGGCTNSSWVDCLASDFRRIGFVAEANGGTKSDKITALRCIASDANNCDDSTTEYNAAFWAENTNNIDWVYCLGYNLAGNAGQTSGRVRGMQAYASGANARGVANVLGCRIYGGAGVLPYGIVVFGEASFLGVVNIVDCFVSKANRGVSTLGNLYRLSIDRLALDTITASTGGYGGIVIDGTGPNPLTYLHIRELTDQNSTYDADSATINFFAPPSGCTYQLTDCQGITHIMRGKVVKLFVEDSSVQCGSTTYSSFLADTMRFDNCDFTLRSGVTYKYPILHFSSVADGAVAQFNGGSFTGGSHWSNEFGGVDSILLVQGTYCNNFTFAISTSGNPSESFQGCYFTGIDATDGAIKTNFLAPTKQIFQVQNCTFMAAAAGSTPIRKWNNDPTKSILQGNVYNTTDLNDFGAVTSAANNVAV